METKKTLTEKIENANLTEIEKNYLTGLSSKLKDGLMSIVIDNFRNTFFAEKIVSAEKTADRKTNISFNDYFAVNLEKWIRNAAQQLTSYNKYMKCFKDLKNKGKHVYSIYIVRYKEDKGYKLITGCSLNTDILPSNSYASLLSAFETSEVGRKKRCEEKGKDFFPYIFTILNENEEEIKKCFSLDKAGQQAVAKDLTGYIFATYSNAKIGAKAAFNDLRRYSVLKTA